MKTETLIIMIFSLIAGLTAYAVDWQLKQDEVSREQELRIENLNALIELQTRLHEQQVKFNEKRFNHPPALINWPANKPNFNPVTE